MVGLDRHRRVMEAKSNRMIAFVRRLLAFDRLLSRVAFAFFVYFYAMSDRRQRRRIARRWNKQRARFVAQATQIQERANMRSFAPGYARAEAAAPAGPAPGAYFGLPGITAWTEQPDNNDGVVTALAQTAPVSAAGLGAFRQVDVVFAWEMEVAWTNTIVNGTSAITTSAYFPYNIIQGTQFSIQNQYNSIDVRSGIDLAIFQLYRPWRHSQVDKRTNLGANPAGQPGASATVGWAAAALPQANLDTGTAFTSASSAISFTLELPVSLIFDVYFDLLKDGTPARSPQRAIVSPQYMAGSARNLQPFVNYAALSVANLDNGPYNIGAGTGTGAGSIKTGIMRQGVYASNNPAMMPVIYDWQYVRQSKQFGISGKAVVDIAIPTVGQVLSLFIRMWDPAANGGLGAPININVVTKCQLQFGSGLFKFNDTPQRAQRRFVKQHGFLPPQGVLIWDLALDDYGRISNAKALNTLTTSGLNIHLEFTVAQSATAYIVLGVEALTYVE